MTEMDHVTQGHAISGAFSSALLRRSSRGETCRMRFVEKELLQVQQVQETVVGGLCLHWGKRCMCYKMDHVRMLFLAKRAERRMALPLLCVAM